MPIDMRGYKVLYENQAYKCLQVEAVYDGATFNEGECIERPKWLRVAVIDHDAQFMSIYDLANQFSFLKETK